MLSVTQRAVPIHAAQLARQGDARALLAIPEARYDIPRLIAGRTFKRDWVSTSPATGAGFYTESATKWAARKVITAAKTIVAEREARRVARAAAEAARHAEPGRIAAKLAAKAVVAARKRQEAAAKREAKIQEATKEAFRSSYKAASFRTAAQGSTWTIRFGEPRIVSDTDEGWIDYKRHGWRKGIKSQTITVTIPLRWDQRVGARDLGIVDGLLTLDAEPVQGAPEGVELYRATWARQGRGLTIDRESGFIARTQPGGVAVYVSLDAPHESGTYWVTYHAATAKAAVSGLKRKLTAQGVPQEVRDAKRQAAAVARAAKQAAGLARLVDRMRKWDFAEIQHVVVERRDSIAAGNCVPGTDEFIERVFPDRDGRTEKATIGEIAARVGRLDATMLKGADLTLARQLAAACLVAVRRDKQARRALAV